MRPLVEKNAPSNPAKISGMILGFQKLEDALKRKNGSLEASSEISKNNSRHQAVKLQTIDKEGVIEKIMVHCSCGETIEIDCCYAD